MAGAPKPAHTEGESNTSDMRRRWREAQSDPATRDLVARDSEAFLHQSLSTPVLSAIRKA